jgi:DNA-binding transcriptional LysR family regulator
MDLRQLAVAVAVAEEGGFTAAAHRLRTVQSTVSTIVRALERDLGTALFDRTTHRVALTAAGEAFMPAARAALAAVEQARATVGGPPVEGRVTVGLQPGLLLDLPRLLTRLRRRHPCLAVTVRRSDVDVMVRAAGPDETAIVEEDLVIVTAAEANPERLPFAGFPSGWAIRDAADRALPGRVPAFEVDELATATELVRHGLAACVLPASVAARFPGLTMRRLDRPARWRLTADRSVRSTAVEAVLAHLT